LRSTDLDVSPVVSTDFSFLGTMYSDDESMAQTYLDTVSYMSIVQDLASYDTAWQRLRVEVKTLVVANKDLIGKMEDVREVCS